ncbi:hypothetical protein [Streptomyces sp. HUAS TT20]|uniref:hypothetical protein n=1 Tax=Streptomyces sp. HUAS TT20 TaxID=3447509 RepID=UPI0021DB324D|nr:hypothetical protein [Streptomyces sp. HUAS 15-9]UXY32382.1 hypothetical protein N8I87_41775 [Streptomyces sp. HUAS 15-9]
MRDLFRFCASEQESVAKAKPPRRSIPPVISLHRVGNMVTPFRHASMVLGEIPVSDVWGAVVREQYDARAKIVILRDPVPAEVDLPYAELTEGLLGEDLPAWLGLMMAMEIRSYARDVPVTVGESSEDILSIGIDPAAPTTFPEWAQQVVPPES